MDLNKDYYKVLELDKSASTEALKKKYRELSKKYHPDRGGDENKFKALSEAYSTLGDAKKKSEYDMKSPHGASYNPNMGGGSFRMEDFFQGFGFGSGGFEFSSNRRTDNFIEELDIRIQINVSPLKIYNNESVDVEFVRNIPCSSCNGTGTEESEDSDECLACGGRGRKNTPFGQIECEYCHGEGRIHTKKCSKCQGSKVKARKERLSIDNIGILRQGSQTVSYRGYGHFSKYYRGKSGNVIIDLNANIPNIKVDGDNIVRDIEVDFLTAIQGGEMKIDHLDGKSYNIKIPQKSNNNTKFKLSGKGFLRRDNITRGDLIFVVNVIIDYSKLTDDKIKKLSEI